MLGLLSLKARILGTRVEPIAHRLRWAAGYPGRRRHPEQWRMHLEDTYIEHAFRALIQPDWNCIDAGAHIGSRTARFRSLAPKGAHIAIEPTPDKAGWIRDRYPDITVHQVAVSDFDGTATFHDQGARGAFSSLGTSGGDAVHRYEVDVRMIDGLVDPGRDYQFVKLDVEGAELPALRGSVELLDRSRPIVLFECGIREAFDAFDYDRPDLHRFFTDRGYEIRSTEDFVFGKSPMGVDEFVKAGEYPFPGFNYFATPADRPPTRIIH